MYKLLKIVVVLSFLIPSTAGYVMAGDRVGYINVQRLVDESTMGKEAKKELQAIRRQKELDAEKQLDRINELKNRIQNDKDKMSISDRKDLTEELQASVKKYQRYVEDAKEAILKEDRELVANILQKADNVLKKVAKKEDFSIILKDANVLGYLDPQVDITERVLKELEKNKGQ